MSKLANVSLSILSVLALTACDNSPRTKQLSNDHAAPQETKTESAPGKSDNPEIKKLSQALGNIMGKSLMSPTNQFDVESIIQGIRDGAAGKPSPMTDQEYEQAMAKLQQDAIAAISQKNLDAANAFLKENANAKDVVEVIPEKLQYIILEKGDGETVKEHGTPQITYIGKYLDGTVFGDSSAADGPITVPLDQTIPGFSKGIQGMKEGEKRRLFVHPDLGYGTTGQLLPNSLLIFDIQVIKASTSDKDSAEAFHGDASDEGNSQDNSSETQDNPQN